MVTQPIVIGPEFDAIPDDTEETLVGSSIHQGAIVSTVTGLEISAQRRELSWFIGNQLTLLIRQEGRALPRRIAPDICVYPTLPFAHAPSIAVAVYGPPALAIEVASPSTAHDSDTNIIDHDVKPQLYAKLGVEEYLVFDPTVEILGTPIWAQRLGPQGIETWLPEGDGRWHSTLGVSFAPQGALLRVYDHDGELVPLSLEFDAMRTEDQRRIAALEAELRRLRGE